MIPELNIYYKGEKIHDEEDYFEMLMYDEDYEKGYSPLQITDYELELVDRFKINIPKGQNIIFETDGSGMLMSDMNDGYFSLNIIYLQLHPEEIFEGEQLRDVQQRVLDDLSKISEDGLGTVTILNIGDIMISYTMLPKINQVKFSINTKENIYRGYCFISNEKPLVENKELIETWFSAIRKSDSKVEKVDVSVDEILSEAYHQIQSTDNELLNVVHNNEFVIIDNNLRIPVFKDFGVLRDMIQYEAKYSKNHMILPLIMAEDINKDFSISSGLLTTRTITVFPNWVKQMQINNPRFRANFHKNKNEALKYHRESDSLNIHTIQVEGLEMIIGQSKHLEELFTIYVNGGDFMYTIHCYLPYGSNEVSNLEIVETWLNRLERVTNIKS